VTPLQRRAAGVTVALVALTLALEVGVFGAWSSLVTNLAQLTAALWAGGAAWRRARDEPRWRTVAIACGLWSMGQVAYTWGVHNGDGPALESLELALFGAAGITAVFAVLGLMPTTRTQRWGLALDGLGAAAALVGVLWLPIFEPSITTNRFAAIFPTVDIAVAVACISLVCMSPRGDRSVIGVASGLVLLAGADLVYVYEEGRGGFVPGTSLDLLWVVAFSVVALSTLVGGHVSLDRRWTPLVPSAPLAALLPSAFFVQLSQGELPPALVFGGVLGGAAFFVREMLLHWEHERLVDEVRFERDLWRVAEERTRLLVEYSSDGLVAADSMGRCVFINSAGAALLGVNGDDLVGRRMHDIVHKARPDGSPFPYDDCSLGAAARAGESFSVDLDWWTTADGCFVPVSLTVHPVTATDHTTQTATVVTFRDISAQVEAHRALEHEASHDGLTGLVNRRAIGEIINRRLDEGQRVGLLLLDLNNFKDVNDALGHSTGDALIAEVGRRLHEITRSGDVVSRFGGDEFGIVIKGVVSERDLLKVADRITTVLNDPFDVGGWMLRVTASIGGAAIDAATGDAEALLQRADIAMYRAKRSGTTLALYGDDDEDDRLTTLTLSADLPRAIAAREIEVHFQPKVDVVTRRIVGVEALAGWTHPSLGPIPPDVFFGIAAHSGLIADLTCHVMRTALEQAAAWSAAWLEVPIALNLAPALLTDPAFVSKVDSAVKRAAIAPHLVTLEITEEGIADADARALGALRELREIGFRVAIDDFGTGYSSLGYLKRLPVDELKIDRSFVTNLASDPTDVRIVRTIVELARAVGLTTVAEGVEDDDSLAVLRAAGCDQAQGFGLHRPAPGADVTRLLAAGRTSDVARFSPASF
jgi:diguanylate cyclase (GGDEF)-like protein/PAS domain S-box-containing protein